MTIRPKLTKTIISFAVVSLLLLIILYSFLGSFEWPPTNIDYFMIVSWAILTGFYLYITIRYGYYKFAKDALHQRRFTTTYLHYYEDVIYIDEEWSRKNEIILFIRNDGRKIYLIMDRKHVLLDEMLTRCNRRLTKEELTFRFPTIKL